MHIIEELRKEKLVSYRPYFTDDRTGKTEAAGYTVSLFPSEVERKKAEQSQGHIRVEYKQSSELRGDTQRKRGKIWIDIR
jgi:hypothetical protein